MIYKRYELSRTLRGNQILHIARNSAGDVVLREPSLKKLRKAIDKREEDRLAAIAEAAKRKASRAKKLASKPSSKTRVKKSSSKPERGPDGRFISKKSEPEEEEPPKKKSFWDKLA